MARYSERDKAPYTADVHQELVVSLTALTDSLLSEGVSQTTYAFGQMEGGSAGVIEAVKRANPSQDPEIFDGIYESSNGNLDGALSILSDMGFTIPGGIKHFAKDDPSHAVNQTLDSFLEVYQVPVSTRIQLEKFRQSFRDWGAGKETSLAQSSQHAYFDSTVIGFREKIDGIIEQINGSFREVPKVSSGMAEGGLQSDIIRIVAAIQGKVKTDTFQGMPVAQFMSGFLDAVQTGTVAEFLADEERIALLGGAVKAKITVCELDSHAQELHALLQNPSSAKTAGLVFQEVKGRYDQVYAQSLS